MPSPFPGMNPYLEQDDVWHDFHTSSIPRLAAAIIEQVADTYIVKITPYTYVHELPTQSARPVIDVEDLSYLEIRDHSDHRLITVIELLSPTNKDIGPNREKYLGKRGNLLGSSAHFVEIDLLRGGPRMPLAERLTDCAYCVLVSRMEERSPTELWPIALCDPLPVIPIPLRTTDPDARIDLQAVLHPIYDGARYGNYIYQGAPYPGLSPTDAAWAKGFVPQQDALAMPRGGGNRSVG